MLSLDKTALELACSKLNIPSLDDDDYVFLNEFKMVLKPIANSITYIEGQRRGFGSYLPVLMKISVCLGDLQRKSGEMKYCGPLLAAIKNGFHTRFGHLMNLDQNNAERVKAVPLFIAMLSDPTMKASFIPKDWIARNRSTFRKMKEVLLTAAEQILQEEKQLNQVEHGQGTFAVATEGKMEFDRTFFITLYLRISIFYNPIRSIPFRSLLTSFIGLGSASGSVSNSNFEFSIEPYDNSDLLEEEFGGKQAIANEISCFLREPVNSEWNYLDQYPTIKKLHMKFNCIFCTEADVERIFSYAGRFEL